MSTELFIIKAYHGDSFLIKSFDFQGRPFNILIDGGPANTFNFSLRNALVGIETIDLLVLTHIDSDHIGGLINFISNSRFQEIDTKKMWINCVNLLRVNNGSTSISYNEGVIFEQWLIDRGVPRHKFDERITTSLRLQCQNGIYFELLSPTTSILDKVTSNWPELSEDYRKKILEIPIANNVTSQLTKGTLIDLADIPFKPKSSIDRDLFNSMSIAFVLRTPNLSFLMLADSRPEIIEESLRSLGYNDTDNRLKVDYVKVSHHGSKNNTSNEILDMIDSNNFIISTNGGVGRSKHPDRETLARILYHPKRDMSKKIKLFFNYPVNAISIASGAFFTDQELEEANAEYFDDVQKLPRDAAQLT